MTPLSATILGCKGDVLDADEAAFLREANPWGFILFARNTLNPEQLRRLTGALREAVGRPAPILIDQEGGRVQRMVPPHWRQWRPALDQMLRTQKGAEARAMRLRYRLIAAELRDVGIDVNCAPLGDLVHTDTHPILQNRLYGRDPVSVMGAGRAVAQGLMEGGVLPVLKHMPGLGRANLDTHDELPVVTEPLDVLDAHDFAPFRGLSDLPLGMTTHVVFDAIDPTAPGTTSPHVVQLIRDRLGFGGLLMTDDIAMNALSGTIGERSAAAIAAGVDIVLHCNGDRIEAEQAVTAAGRLRPEAMARAADAIDRRAQIEPLDTDAVEAELAALVDGGPYA